MLEVRSLPSQTHLCASDASTSLSPLSLSRNLPLSLLSLSRNSFSTTDTLEGQSKIAGGELLSLSEQQFVDCSTKNGACNGGLMTLALDYAMEAGGVESEADYGYTGRKGQCQFDESKVAFTLEGYNNITSGSESDLVAALQEVGPVAVAIDASHITFQLYKKGVYNPHTCSKTALDHGVGLVGADYSDSSKPYLIVKNSWGAGFVLWCACGYVLVADLGFFSLCLLSLLCRSRLSTSLPIQLGAEGLH